MRNFQCTDTDLRIHAQVNHYIVKDAQSFVLKNIRGSAHQAQRDIGQHYWLKRNKNQAVDTSILKVSGPVRAEMARLDALTNGRLSELTHQARVHHREKFTKALETDEGVELYKYCLSHLSIAGGVQELNLF